MLSCSKDVSPTIKNVYFSTIANGDAGAYGFTESNVIIKDNVIWTDLKNQMNPHNLGLNNFSETNIDFNCYQIIAVFDKLYPYLGHEINITKIIENNSHLIISIEKKHTPTLLPATVQPYHIVKIKKTDKNIVFE